MDGLGEMLLLSKEAAERRVRQQQAGTQQALSQPVWELEGGGSGQAAWASIHVLTPLLRVLTQEVTWFSHLIFARSGLQSNKEMASPLSVLPAALFKTQICFFILN